MKTHRIAAIDIGSNSLKLAVIEAAASDSFTIISQDRERVRLGHGTLQNHILPEEAFELSAEAISRFRSIAETREADTLIAVATASLREAKNATEFVAEVKKRTGVQIVVLPSLEEARLIGIAAATFFGSERRRVLNIDIGGGSTEISLMENGTPKKLFSMKLGAVGLTEKHLKSDPPKPDEIEQLKKEIAFALEKPCRKLQDEEWDVASGTSGTILSLSGTIGFDDSEDILASAPIKLSRLEGMNKILSQLKTSNRVHIPALNERRAEVIVAGGLILEGVMRALKIEMLEPCTYALREGVIIDHINEIETESVPPVPDVDDIKLRDVFAIGRRFGYEENHAIQVARMAELIFDELVLNFAFPRHERTLLSAAALLHDVGYHISHEAHHKHSYYLIKHSEMTGFTEDEKSIIASVARYHRKSFPKNSHLEYLELEPESQQVVDRLSSILRIADALDRGYESRVEAVRIRKVEGGLELLLESHEDCTNEIYAIEMKKDMFETTFGSKLFVVQKAPESAVSNT